MARLVFVLFSCWLLALVVTAQQEVKSARPHGVDPLSEKHYDKTAGVVFKCRDGLQEVPWEHLNDDFCDCEDGSDEPGTSACPANKFYCRNEPAVGKFIFSSRVSDGICDCCDGSDEIDIKTGKTKCANTCAAEAEQAYASLMEEVKLVEAGLAEKTANKAALQLKERKLAEKKNLDVELAEVEKAITSLEMTKALAQKAYDDKKVIKEAEFKLQFGVKEEEKPVEGEKKEDEKAAVDEDDEWEDDEDDDYEDVAEAGGAQAEAAQADSPQAKVEKAMQEDQELRGLSFDVTTRNEDLEKMRSRKTQIDTELNEINKIVNIDFGPDGAFAPLWGQEISKEIGEYTWKVKPFQEAHQSFTSLGNFASWLKPHTVMSFTGGQMCWGGPARSVEVTFSCGSQSEIIEVREPSKCTYTMSVRTPFACTEEQLAGLKSRLPGTPPQAKEEKKGGFFGSIF